MSGSEAMQFMRLVEVVKMTRLSKSHIYAMTKRGDFPAPVKLSAFVSVWVESDIQAWMSARVAKARAAILSDTQDASSSR